MGDFVKLATTPPLLIARSQQGGGGVARITTDRSRSRTPGPSSRPPPVSVTFSVDGKVQIQKVRPRNQ